MAKFAMAKKPVAPAVPEARIARILIARRRLIVSLIAGALLFLVLPQSMPVATRCLLAWDLTAAIYVIVAFVMVARSSVQTCRARAALYDDSDWIIITIIVAAAAASFGAILAELPAIKSMQVPLAIGVAVAALTVALSWTMTHVVFTMHYANIYWRPHGDRTPGGLQFPGERLPDYRDFLYYAFVIGCASQTADVNTISPEMRRVTLIHGVVSFAFNTAILALTINVGASLLS
jgi:uncharacterized membrane protein